MMANLKPFPELRLKKLEELHRIITDPLLDNLNLQAPGLNQFLNANEGLDESFNVKSFFADGSEPNTLESLIAQNVQKSLFDPSTRINKRKSDSDSTEEKSRSRKIFKSNSNSRLSRPNSLFNPKQQKKVSSVKSLKTQDEVSQEEIDDFLNRDISELEILSVPEHYPTKPHNVSSLAELYYLTQTLPLIKLLPGSHKALMTDNFELALLEGKIAVLYSRIEELKRQGKWSLRQPQRFYDPFTYAKKSKKYTFHWDSLVQEGKWMAADFKEGAKFKKSCCVILAQAVKDYWVHGKTVCIKTKPIVHLPENIEVEPKEEENVDGGVDVEMEESAPVVESTVEKTEEIKEEPETIDTNLLLKKSNQEEEVTFSFLNSATVSAGDIPKPFQDDTSPFKLHVDVNNLKRIDQSIIRNLPKFSAFEDESPNAPAHALKPKDSPLVPVSRLLHPFEEDDDWFKIVLKETDKKAKSSKSQGPPEYQKGLFGFQSHRRFNYLKPPKPPLIKNIEYRSPTIWLPQDDKYLIHYVAEFCFNWELISEHLSSSASSLKKYESNIERRTPWQCFERYIQLNEKFQFSDMKGVYSYHAQQWLEHAHKAQSTTKRRISPLGVGAESIQRGHRRLRWASLFDAVRKCMKKREISAAKVNSKRTTGDYTSTNGSTANTSTPTTASAAPSQGGTAQNAAIANSSAPNASVQSSGQNPGLPAAPGQPSNFANPGTKRVVDRVPTPAELAKLKFERDKSIQEAYINQQATRSRMMAAVAQQQQQKQQQLNTAGGPRSASSQSSAVPNSNSSSIGPQQRVPIGPGSIPPNKTAPNAPTGPITHPSQSIPPNQRPRSGGMPVPGKRPTTPNGTPYTPEQIQQLLQIQKQRRLMQQQNQQNQQIKSGAPSQQNSPAMMQNMPLNKPLISNSQQLQNSPQVNNAQLNLQPQNQQNPQANQQVQSGSAPVTKPRIHFAPAQVSAIINSIQQKNPGFSKEQVTKLAAQYLANLQQQQQERFNQQQQQNRLNQTSSQQGSSNQTQFRPTTNSQQPPHKQAQIATLTPQERNQLQMLKAAKTAQQQQLQQLQQLQQQQHPNFSQQRKNGSPAGPTSPLDINNMSKLEYEQRKKAMIQKQQQQQQQQQQQRIQGANISPVSGSATPRMSSSASSPGNTSGYHNNSGSN